MSSIVFDQSGCSVVRFETQMDGTCNLVLEEGSLFALIKASELSVQEPWFLYHQPITLEEQNPKQGLWRVIQEGVSDFYIPRCAPAFSEDGKAISFDLGKMPALGKSYCWWHVAAEAYAPYRHSRLGTVKEYLAFLGCLIKSWVEFGCPIEIAWSTVCNDSDAVGYYQNSMNWYPSPRPTGSCENFGLCDLGNVKKILSYDWNHDAYPVFSGSWNNVSYRYPLGKMEYYLDRTAPNFDAVGWIVLEQ